MQEEQSDSLQQIFLNGKFESKKLLAISESTDYHQIIDFVSFFEKSFNTSNRYISLKQTVLKNQSQQSTQKCQAFIDTLQIKDLKVIYKCFSNFRKKVQWTVFSIRIKQILRQLQEKSLKSTPSQKIETQLLKFNDFDFEQQELKNSQMIHDLSAVTNSFQTKISEFLKNPKQFLNGKFSNHQYILKLLEGDLFPLLQRYIMSISSTNHTQRQKQLEKILRFIADFYIVQFQIQAHTSKNNLVETRIFNNKIIKQLLIQNHKILIKPISRILNEGLLCPSNISIQLIIFKILRRIYTLLNNTPFLTNMQNFMQGESSPLSTLSSIKHPLFLNLRNIALYGSNQQSQIKEPAMFIYKTTRDKNDIELSSLIEKCEEMRFIKNSKYYSSKAFAFSDQLDHIYDIYELSLPYLKYRQHIPPRQYWSYNIIIQKPSTLVFLEFTLSNLDIRFGLYKLDSLKKINLEEYEKNGTCKEIIKMVKVHSEQGGNPYTYCNHIYLKHGFYQIIFDNSYSMIRSKDIQFLVLQLQSSI